MVVSSAQLRVTSNPSVVTVSTTSTPSVIANMSVRSRTGPTAAQATLLGFTFQDAPKTLLLRAAGPALATLGVAGALPNPQFVVRAGSQDFANNDNWAESPPVSLAAGQVGAFPFANGSADAAVVSTLSPGSWTLMVTSATPASGITLTELYDLDGTPGRDSRGSRLLNVSARASVGAGDSVLIAGFTISGTDPKRVLIRAAGLTLIALGQLDALLDPKLELFRGSTMIGNNDNWGGSSTLLNAFRQVGAFSFLSRTSPDAAMIATLPPGNYTAQVSSTGVGTGTALLEVYELP